MYRNDADIKDTTQTKTKALKMRQPIVSCTTNLKMYYSYIVYTLSGDIPIGYRSLKVYYIYNVISKLICDNTTIIVLWLL